MFVLANGAYKSGSTWLYSILCELKKFDEIPAPYQKRVFKQMWVDPMKLKAFLESGCYRERDYISKGHYGGKESRELLLSHSDVIVLDITRDLRDTIVSHYYHFSRMYRVDWPFEKYYWRVGRYKAFNIKQYHQTWSIPAPNVYVSSFERLKCDFRSEVRRIAQAIGQDVDDDVIDRVQEATTLSAMRQRRSKSESSGPQKFFRKGEIGDWERHFDARALADIQRIEERGLPLVGRGIYALLFDVRNAVKFKLGSVLEPRTNSAV